MPWCRANIAVGHQHADGVANAGVDDGCFSTPPAPMIRITIAILFTAFQKRSSPTACHDHARCQRVQCNHHRNKHRNRRGTNKVNHSQAGVSFTSQILAMVVEIIISPGSTAPESKRRKRADYSYHRLICFQEWWRWALKIAEELGRIRPAQITLGIVTSTP